MSYDLILANLTAILLIMFVLWWFFGSKPKAKTAAQDEVIKITVKDGIYDPANIVVQQGKPIRLQFIRHDPTPCAETVVFAALDLTYSLPLHQTIDITLPPQSPKAIEFTCQMGMYRGSITVV